MRLNSSRFHVQLAILFLASLGFSFCANAGSIPTGWSDADIGTVGIAGSASFATNAYTVNAAGQGISFGTTSDGFNFVYQSLSGDGSVVARVNNIQGATSPKVGVMIRETLNAGSTNVSAFFTPNTAVMYSRASTGASTASQTTSFASSAYPYWVKLVRSGSTFAAYLSLDGIYWMQIGSNQTITMAQNALIGLAVSSQSTSTLVTATIDNVSVSSTTAPAPAITAVSATTGSVGSHVTITGTAFGTSHGSSLVYLNGAAVTVSSWSANSIAITIPTGATTGLLVVSVAPGMIDSNPLTFEVTPQPLLAPWLNRDVAVPGQIGLAGSATYSNRTFTVSAAGQGISYGTSSDAFHFVYQPLSGDGSIVARVSNIQGATSPKVGVMIRETLDPASTNGSDFFSPNTAVTYNRPTTSATTSSQSTGLAASAYPYWVKLTRSGDLVLGYISLDGVYWTQTGTGAAVTMSEDAYVGLAVSSDSTSTLVTATFDNVSIDSTTSPAPTITSLSATTGSVGSQVVIYGTGFGSTQGSSVVSLNGAAMTVNSWSANSITITLPAGATSGLMGVSVAPTMNNSNTVTFTVTTQPLASSWLDADIGNVGVAGSATYSTGAFAVHAAGQGIYNTLDGFHFVYQPLSGDGSIVARVSNVQGGGGASQIGVMIRETLHPDATNAFVKFYPNGVSFYNRATTGASTTLQFTSFTGPTYPYWVQLTRAGNVFNAYVSSDGVNWTQAGTSQTIPMAQSVFIGLAASNQSTSNLVTATYDSVSVSSDLLVPPVITSLSATTGAIGTQVSVYGSGFGATQGSSVVLLNGSPVTIRSWSNTTIGITIPTGASSGYLEVLQGTSMNSSNPMTFAVTTQPLPTGWLDADIGNVGVAGSATYSSGVFTINAAGTGISGTADGMHFIYKSLTGDGTVVARVTNTGGNASNRVGVMIRETLNPGATDAFVDFSPNSSSYRDRATTGGNTGIQSTSFTGPTYPYWVKLARASNSFSAYVSLDGSTWTPVGTAQTISMASTVYIGLGATSQTTSTLITGTLDNVSVTSGTMPIISGVAPASGGIGTSVTITGSNFGSPQGTSTINFNGIPATSIASWTSNQIVATVPSNAISGPVTVVVSSIPSNGNFPFTFYHPVISSLSPPTAGIGSIVIVNGSGFTSGQGPGSQVLFNGVAAGVATWTDTSITVALPANATTGPVTVTKSGVVSNSVTFTVENLSVTSISPTSGAVGSVVRIFGTGFGSAQTTSTVDFYGTSASLQSWSDTEIDAIVPAGASTGSVDVGVGELLWYGPQFTLTRTTQLTDSKSNQSHYTSALIGGVWLPTLSQGSGCSSCTQRGNISYTYDSFAHPLTRIDENGNTTSYTYDTSGNVLTVTVPITPGHTATTTYTYNSFGEVLTVTDALGNVTTNTYDSKGNLVSVTTPAPGGGPAASVTRFAYDALGDLTSITDPLGNQTAIAYFPTGLIQTITDAKSNVTTYAYDSRGNRTSVTDANNKQTTFTYDAMNRLTKITYPDTTTTQFGYDIRGRRTSVTDQNSKQTTYAYDDADRLTTVTDAANNVTTYGYDTENNLTSIKDANLNSTTFDYDALGRVTETHFPSGKVEMNGYDNVGNLTSKTDRKNQSITYTYDQLNRLTLETYPDTTAVNYTFDDDSRLTQVTDPTGTYKFTFDNMGRLTGTTTSYSFLTGRNFTTAYAYDAASNRTGFTDPESGSTTYVYDTLNRLQTLTPPTAYGTGSFGFTYDNLSRRTSLTRPNAVNTTYGYDNLSRLLSVTHANGSTTLDGATYTVDNAGNRLTRTPQPGGTVSTFGYDNIYELLSVTQGGTTKEGYTYDPVGNRLTSLGSAAWAYNASNELNSRPSFTYTYDLNGNTQTSVGPSGTTTYSWDFENRLTGVTLPGSGGTVTFKYDPFGRRIYKSSSSATSIYAYDGDNLAEEANATGAAVARYMQSANVDEPLAMLRSNTSYYEGDGLGSLTSLSNASGSLANNYTYDSFGNLVTSAGSLTNSFRYTGREFDSETALYYYRARYYDETSGRFLSEDPIGFGGGVHFYAYVGNNPVGLVDPFGLDWLNNAADFSAGAGDALSFGLTALARKYIFHTDCVVNTNSVAYFGGTVTGALVGAALGNEIAARPNTTQIKIAVHEAHHTFGNFGKLPHIQINVWQNGVSGSGWALRVPFPR